MLNGDDKKIEQIISLINKSVREKYEEELEREKSLLTQASNMQTAFSVTTAALFMLLPVLVQYKPDKIPLRFYFISVSAVVAFLLLSLVLATLAQWREEKALLPDIETMMEDVKSKLPQLLDDETLWTSDSNKMYGMMQKELEQLNNRRCNMICASMICFFIAIFTCFLAYIVGLALYL